MQVKAPVFCDQANSPKGASPVADQMAEEYEAPTLTKLGTLSELTMGGTGIIHGDLMLSIGSLLNIGVKLGL
jgi:hypothetical protein